METYRNIKNSLRNLFNHLTRGEGTEDIARKDEAIKSLLDYSQLLTSATEEQRTKLTEMLKGVKTRDLDDLLLKGVAVGIDPRLELQPKGVRHIDAVFYSLGDKGGLLALSPRGNPVYPDGNTRDIVSSLASVLNAHRKDGEILYAAYTVQAVGRAVAAGTWWYSPEIAPIPYLAQHPELRKPPGAAFKRHKPAR